MHGRSVDGLVAFRLKWCNRVPTKEQNFKYRWNEKIWVPAIWWEHVTLDNFTWQSEKKGKRKEKSCQQPQVVGSKGSLQSKTAAFYSSSKSNDTHCYPVPLLVKSIFLLNFDLELVLFTKHFKYLAQIFSWINKYLIFVSSVWIVLYLSYPLK